MDEIKVTLNRKLGPFKVWQWVLVIIVGVGIGILIRRRLGTGGGTEAESVSAQNDPTSLDYLPTQGAQAGTNQGDADSFYREVTDLIREQNRALETINAGRDDEGDQGTGDNNRGGGLFPGPTNPPKLPPVIIKAPATPKPVAPKTTPIDPDKKIKDSIAAAFQAAGFPAPSYDSARMNRLVSEVKRGRSYADITYQLKMLKYQQGEGPNPGKDPQDFKYGT